MKIALPVSAFAAALVATTAFAQTPATPAQVIAAAPAADWQAIPAQDLLILTFAGNRTVVLQLAPAFAPTHVANIRALVADGWFPRHAKIVRVQENYVVQWGDPTEKAPLPASIVKTPTDGYEQAGKPTGFAPLPYPDAYGAVVGHASGWPVATDDTSHWLPHCPGMLGVGRNMAPDTGTGAELYVVIGHGPRHLDRNIALVGRVVEGIENLSALPRGEGALGMYRRPEQRIPLVSARFAADLPAAEQPRFEVLSAGSLAKWAHVRANRQDDFFIRPAGGADICNLQPPIRRVAQAK